MEKIFSEEQVSKTSKVSTRVFQIIHSRWPVNPLEVAKFLGDKGKIKTLSAKYLYHFKKLANEEHIRLKKVGNTYIAWPTDVEKLRVIHELIRGA